MTWEYKIVIRERKFGVFASRASSWNMSVEEILGPAGADGWELASVVPSSNTGKPLAFTGSADRELWIFKRPKNG